MVGVTEWQWEALDWQLGDLLAEFEQGNTALLKQSVRMLSHQMRAGDTCLYLPEFAGQTLDEAGRLPDVKTWARQLAEYDSVGGHAAPLVLDGPENSAARLYFQRYWKYEQKLAASLLNLARQNPPSPDRIWLESRLDQLPLAEQQKQAIQRAFTHGLCVISGGPGTGKTTTISALVTLLNTWRPELKITLAAPTGKAAARMQESVRGAAEFLGLDKEKLVLAHEASTLHRLLGFQRGKVGFKHNADNPIPADVVIVDEASMIDLALMSKLLDAVHPDARLILLGDKDQLASVEAGEVMATLCEDVSDNPLRDNVVVLDQVHRYSADTGISSLAQAVNDGNGKLALDILLSPQLDDVRLLDPGSPQWREYLLEKSVDRLGQNPIQALTRFQVLCALRNGPYGVSGMNQWIELQLAQDGRIPPHSVWYHGRPVMVTRNSPALKLYNGDIGVAVRHAGQLRVSFPDAAGGQRQLSTARLPQHETAWSMTVHKSQGSEFEEVMLILPNELSAVLTRELIYTAVTRARTRLTVVGDAKILQSAVAEFARRHSGLGARLRHLKS